MIEFIDQGIGVLVLIGQVSVAVVVVLLIQRYVTGQSNRVLTWFGRNAIPLAFFAALAAMLGSLFYSDIKNYTPCLLCWYQRIFIYPLTFLLGIAWLKDDKAVWRYVLPLASIGGLIAAFHYIEQVTTNPLAPCGAIGYSVSCAEHFVLRYGYITIPLMAVTACAMVIVFRLADKNK